LERRSPLTPPSVGRASHPPLDVANRSSVASADTRGSSPLLKVGQFKTADLPVQQASKIELLLNLRLQTLGITVPQSIQNRAPKRIAFSRSTSVDAHAGDP
jgi:hypothetical protein